MYAHRYFNGKLLKQKDGSVKELSNDDPTGVMRYIQSVQMRIFFDKMDAAKAERQQQHQERARRDASEPPQRTAKRRSFATTQSSLEEL